jgi:hypothetical protein
VLIKEKTPLVQNFYKAIQVGRTVLNFSLKDNVPQAGASGQTTIRKLETPEPFRQDKNLASSKLVEPWEKFEKPTLRELDPHRYEVVYEPPAEPNPNDEPILNEEVPNTLP